MRETIQNANGKQFHAVSLSGGKDSTAMLLLMIERDMPINNRRPCSHKSPALLQSACCHGILILEKHNVFEKEAVKCLF